MLDSLTFRTARTQVHAFRSESDELELRRQASQQFADCLGFLQLGIDAFQWLERARRQIEQAIRDGKLEPTAELDDAIEALYRLWLPAAELAQSRIGEFESASQFENFDEFRECKRLVELRVADFDKLEELRRRVPSVADLESIAIDPQEWLNEPGWS